MKADPRPVAGLILTLILALLLAGCGLVEDASPEIKAEDKLPTKSLQETNAGEPEETTAGLQVHFLDIGQGDSIFIASGNQYMLIDGGTNAAGQDVVGYLKQQGVEKLDYLIATHPHEDHIGGVDDVLKDFEIGKIFMPKVMHTTKTFEDVLLAVQAKGLKITAPQAGDTFQLGKASCTIISPSREKYKDLNNYSLVVRLEYEGIAFLFTGDAEALVEKEMLAGNNALEADVLKVAHHGSSTSTTANFLDQVHPKYAIITVGKGNDYGHPHQEIMTKLKKRGISVYRTDENGTIIARVSQGELSFNVKPASYRSGQKNN